MYVYSLETFLVEAEFLFGAFELLFDRRLLHFWYHGGGTTEKDIDILPQMTLVQIRKDGGPQWAAVKGGCEQPRNGIPFGQVDRNGLGEDALAGQERLIVRTGPLDSNVDFGSPTDDLIRGTARQRTDWQLLNLPGRL